MVTLEQKIDIILEWITNNDPDLNEEIQLKAKTALTLSSDKAYASVNPAVDVDDMIVDLFKELGIHSNLKGYKYVFTSVKLVLADPERIKAIVKRIYAEVAAEYDTNASCVERSIRTVVDSMIDCGDFESICNILGNIVSTKNGGIHNSTFIAACAQEVQRRMKRLGFKIM